MGVLTARSISLWSKFASDAVRIYCRWSPIARGKHWLLRRSAGFLIAPIENGNWIRVSGASGFEWKAFRRQPCEPATVDLIRKLLRPGSVMFDVGANVGYYALVAAKSVAPGGRVFAFEATPAVATRLRENLGLNRIENVNAVHAAVCDKSGEIDLRLQDDDSEGNSLVNFSSEWPSVRVPAVALDDFVAENKIARVDVLKIDVEGAEPLVLAGATRLLSSVGRPILIFESNPVALRAGGSSLSALTARLAVFGYRCFGVERLTDGSDAAWNVVALHPDHESLVFDASINVATLPPFGSNCVS